MSLFCTATNGHITGNPALVNRCTLPAGHQTPHHYEWKRDYEHLRLFA